MKKFYAVSSGNKIGIFESWEECKPHVINYSGAKFKSFETVEEAREWLDDQREKMHTKCKTADYVVYTDGACSGNPGPGGYAAIIVDSKNNSERIVASKELITTNNRMEMQAVISALSVVPKDSNISVYTDSKYVKDAFTSSWIKNWKKNSWHTSSNNPVKNQDLWERLDSIIVNNHLNVDWNWVKGHNNDSYNERCNAIAQKLSQQAKAEKKAVKC